MPDKEVCMCTALDLTGNEIKVFTTVLTIYMLFCMWSTIYSQNKVFCVFFLHATVIAVLTA